jgi:hypothetical protein
MKVRIVEPEETVVARNQLVSTFPRNEYTNATIEEILQAVFFCGQYRSYIRSINTAINI